MAARPHALVSPLTRYSYHKNSARKQLAVHAGSILAAIVVFIVSMNVPRGLGSDVQWDDEHEREEDESLRSHAIATGLWLLAVALEQFGNSYGAVYMKLPFPAAYAGERMQAWLMLCFGESVIALLIEPIFFLDKTQLGSIVAAFFMILCICTEYFDIVDADQFLHLYFVRGENLKAMAYMNFQCLFSFFVFLTGVALKTIIFVSETVYALETASGCGDAHTSFDGHRQLLTDGHHGRRLGSWSVVELDSVLFKAFVMLCVSISATVTATMIIGYSMPTEVPSPQVHISRVGTVLICLTTLFVPYNLDTIATDCLLGAEGDASSYGTSYGTSYGSSARLLGSSFSGGAEEDTARKGSLSLMNALVTISLIILASFVVALGSLDPDREETYAVLEETASYIKARAHLERRKKKTTNLVSMYKSGAQMARRTVDAVKVNITPLKERARRMSRDSYDSIFGPGGAPAAKVPVPAPRTSVRRDSNKASIGAALAACPEGGSVKETKDDLDP